MADPNCRLTVIVIMMMMTMMVMMTMVMKIIMKGLFTLKMGILHIPRYLCIYIFTYISDITIIYTQACIYIHCK